MKEKEYRIICRTEPARTETRRNIREFIHRCATELLIKNPILDVACGYRSSWPEIALGLNQEQLIQYVALDWRLFFPKKINSLGPNLCANALFLPFKEDSFSTVVSTEALEHIEDGQQAVREMHRVLKKNGFLILTVPGFDYPPHGKPHNPDYRRYTTDSLEVLLKEAGFTNPFIEDCHSTEGKQINIFTVCQK